MSRSGSFDIMEPLTARTASGSKESNTSPNGCTPLSQTQTHTTSPLEEKPSSLDRRNPASDTREESTAASVEPNETLAGHRRADSSSSQGTTGSSHASGIKPAMSFPQSMHKEREKRPDQSPCNTISPASSQLGLNTMVDFPEIDRSLSHQEHMSIHGIDDSSVEVLRHYEDTTGHMLPRSAIEDTIKSRRASPMPPDRQTAAGPSPAPSAKTSPSIR
ncbi:hypothetical protein P389DRAFT_15479 [Cystobasidium minutum MCA 4210]|uniref:uncharacterized protein n=1 Tax=Cystobasidium minutum MCA 4210 TaxID=1397322 RepID=UPI0034CDEAD6|eukprot:jgi/Rhomi1/15479/CE15478_1149